MVYHSIKNKQGISHRKGWAILARNLETNEYLGYYDASLVSMGWSDWVVLVRDHPLPQKTVNDLQKKHKDYDIFQVRVNSKKSPIMVDWTARNKDRSTHKGNRPFKVRHKC